MSTEELRMMFGFIGTMVERIGESQRFLTRALGERSVIDAPRTESSGRVITPH
jgi:hypothetical protein